MIILTRWIDFWSCFGSIRARLIVILVLIIVIDGGVVIVTGLRIFGCSILASLGALIRIILIGSVGTCVIRFICACC